MVLWHFMMDIYHPSHYPKAGTSVAIAQADVASSILNINLTAKLTPELGNVATQYLYNLKHTHTNPSSSPLWFHPLCDMWYIFSALPHAVPVRPDYQFGNNIHRESGMNHPPLSHRIGYAMMQHPQLHKLLRLVTIIQMTFPQAREAHIPYGCCANRLILEYT